MSILNALKVSLTPVSSIAKNIEGLFKSAILNTSHVNEIDIVLSKLIPNGGQLRYKTVASIVNKDMPWWVVCLEHAMECGVEKYPFNYHIYNGDSLTARTFDVPKGRPKFNPHNGNVPPSVNNPYTWEESTIDALKLAGYDKQTDFSLGNILYGFEEFNGLGYRKYHPTVNTPYLWSFTNQYTKGKYVQDGKWNADAVSKQPGCAAYLLRMKEQEVITV